MTDSSLFEAKRLLVLGAGHYQLPVINRALSLGCHVITSDYLPNNPGHRIASESWDISTVDLDAILELARSRRVDAVLTYGSDVSVPTVAFVAEQLGLPGNSLHTATLLQRKHLIRELQQAAGLPHPPFAYAMTAGNLVQQVRANALRFPLLVKPADSSGSKGQSVARSLDELPASFEIARPFSRCAVVLAETILPDDMIEVVAEVLVDEGQVVFGHYGHNYFDAEGHPRVPVGEVVPGFFDEWVVSELDRQIQALVDAAGVRTSCMNFDVVVSGGKVFMVDIGMRNGGNLLDDAIQISTGVDLTSAAICYAFGQHFDVPSLHIRHAKWVVTHIVHSQREGRFREVRIAKELEPWIASTTVFCREGDPVTAYTRGDAGLGVITMTPASRAGAQDLVANLRHLLTVVVE